MRNSAASRPGRPILAAALLAAVALARHARAQTAQRGVEPVVLKGVEAGRLVGLRGRDRLRAVPLRRADRRARRPQRHVVVPPPRTGARSTRSRPTAGTARSSPRSRCRSTSVSVLPREPEHRLRRLLRRRHGARLRLGRRVLEDDRRYVQPGSTRRATGRRPTRCRRSTTTTRSPSWRATPARRRRSARRAGRARRDNQELALADPLDPRRRATCTSSGSPAASFDAANGYVAYARDANADEYIDRNSFPRRRPRAARPRATPATGRTSRARSACRYPASRLAGLDRPLPARRRDRHDRHVPVVGERPLDGPRAARRQAGQPGVYGPDLIDRWKGRAFQQSPDSTISLVGFEDEQVNWEANSSLLGERVGPVRALRETWGADSGTNVTKLETLLPRRDRLPVPRPRAPDPARRPLHVVGLQRRRRRHVLQHPASPTASPSTASTTTSATSTASAAARVLRLPRPDLQPAAGVPQWEEVSGAGTTGSLVYVVELKGATTLVNPAVVPYYRDDKCLDDGTGDDPVQRPWPGEASTDLRVRNGYAGGRTAARRTTPSTCDQRQGALGLHGIHYLVTGDTDNAAARDPHRDRRPAMAVRRADRGTGERGRGLRQRRAGAAPDRGDLDGPRAERATGRRRPVRDDVGGHALSITLDGTDVDTCELTFCDRHAAGERHAERRRPRRARPACRTPTARRSSTRRAPASPAATRSRTP